MAIDPTDLLKFVASEVDRLEAEFGPSAEIADAMLVFEIIHTGDLPGEEEDIIDYPILDDGSKYSATRYKTMSGRHVVALGLTLRMCEHLDITAKYGS